MDSSKQEDGKEKKSGDKRLRTNQHDSSSQVATSSASTDQGGSNETQESMFSLNILPPEIIDLIADFLSIMDCLNVQKAFARDPGPAVSNIRNGIAANLAKQRALYLLMDNDEYDVKYQYNYQMESRLSNDFLPTLKGLPISFEVFNMITLPELEMDGSLGISCLKQTFPNVVELKVVLRVWSPNWLTKLARVVTTFSRQLTALQLFIFKDGFDLIPWGTNYLLRLFSHLNDAHFDHLRHFTLLFEETEETCIHPLDLKSLRLLSSETLEECYLRLSDQVIEHQLKLLEANQGLQRLGIIASCIEVNEGCININDIGLSEELLGYLGRINKKILTSSSLSAKIVHLMFPSEYRSRTVAASFFGWRAYLMPLDGYTSLRTLHISLNTDWGYLKLMNKLRELGSLTHLKIILRYVPVSMLTFCRPLSELAPCSPSVTHLKIEVVSIAGLPEEEAEEGDLVEFSHLIFSHLSILQHFPNLQQFVVVFPRAYSCSLCNLTPANDGQECMEMAMQPFRALDQLKASFSRF